jgi:hypothetical protein
LEGAFGGEDEGVGWVVADGDARGMQGGAEEKENAIAAENKVVHGVAAGRCRDEEGFGAGRQMHRREIVLLNALFRAIVLP